MKLKQKAAIVLSVLLVLVCLAGCGGVVDTKMTVDDAFRGERVISVTVSNDDLEKVTGGFEGLNRVATESLPSQMTYLGATTADGCVLTFTVSFTDKKDYIQKVTQLLKAGDEKAEAPGVAFENADTVFKKGLLVREDFNSVDLLKWYQNALSKANIITSSSGNWYEYGKNELVLNGKSYDASSGDFRISEQEAYPLNDCGIHTTMNPDGSFERTITFSANEDTVKNLAEKRNTVLKDYLAALAPQDCEFTADDANRWKNYTFRFSAENADEMIAKTNAILQSDGNTFSVTATPIDSEPGMAELKISESNDASYYLSATNGVDSQVTLYPNTHAVNKDGTAEGRTADSFSESNEKPGAVYENTFRWQICFGKVEIELIPSGVKKAKVVLRFENASGMDEALQASAVERIRQNLPEGVRFKKTGDGCTLTASGTLEQLNRSLSALGSDSQSFRIQQHKMEIPSHFRSGIVSSATYNFDKLIGDQELIFKGKNGLFHRVTAAGNVYYDKDGAMKVGPHGSIKVYTQSISVGGILLAAVAVLLLAAGIVGILMSYREFFREASAAAQRKKAAAAATAAAVQAAAPAAQPVAPAVSQGQPAPAANPAPAAPESPADKEAPAAPVQQAENETREEEDLL